jgi:hypothetical protein
MKTSPFTIMTDEQRAQIQINRLEEQEYARSHFKTEYSDHTHWVELASKYGSKLPMWWKPSSDYKYLRRIAKKANFDINLFVESTGCSNIKEYVSLNQHLSAIGVVGPLLEYIEQHFTNPPTFPVEIPFKSRQKSVK